MSHEEGSTESQSNGNTAAVTFIDHDSESRSSQNHGDRASLNAPIHNLYRPGDSVGYGEEEMRDIAKEMGKELRKLERKTLVHQKELLGFSGKDLRAAILSDGEGDEDDDLYNEDDIVRSDRGGGGDMSDSRSPIARRDRTNQHRHGRATTESHRQRSAKSRGRKKTNNRRGRSNYRDHAGMMMKNASRHRSASVEMDLDGSFTSSLGSRSPTGQPDRARRKRAKERNRRRGSDEYLDVGMSSKSARRKLERLTSNISFLNRMLDQQKRRKGKTLDDLKMIKEMEDQLQEMQDICEDTEAELQRHDKKVNKRVQRLQSDNRGLKSKIKEWEEKEEDIVAMARSNSQRTHDLKRASLGGDSYLQRTPQFMSPRKTPSSQQQGHGHFDQSLQLHPNGSRMSDHVQSLEQGNHRVQASSNQVYARPLSPFAAQQLLGANNGMTGPVGGGPSGGTGGMVGTGPMQGAGIMVGGGAGGPAGIGPMGLNSGITPHHAMNGGTGVGLYPQNGGGTGMTQSMMHGNNDMINGTPHHMHHLSHHPNPPHVSGQFLEPGNGYASQSMSPPYSSRGGPTDGLEGHVTEYDGRTRRSKHKFSRNWRIAGTVVVLLAAVLIVRKIFGSNGSSSNPPHGMSSASATVSRTAPRAVRAPTRGIRR